MSKRGAKGAYKNEKILEMAHELAKYPLLVNVSCHGHRHANERETKVCKRHIDDVTIGTGVFVELSLDDDVNDEAIAF